MDCGTAIITTGHPQAPASHTSLIPSAPVRRSRHFWTTREIAVVKEHYPAGGLLPCIERLPGRSAPAIYQQARVLGLLSPAAKKQEFARRRWTTTEHIDAAICRA